MNHTYVLCFDYNQIPGALATAKSIAQYCPSHEIVFITNTDVSQWQGHFDEYGRVIQFSIPNPKQIRMHRDRGSVFFYAVMYIPDLLPDKKKVIFLDCDIIVIKDLTNFWEMDLEGLPVAGYVTRPWKSETSAIKDPDIRGLHVNAMSTCILVMDLDQWREKKIGKICIDMARDIGDQFVNADQTALNLYLRGQFLLLHNGLVNFGDYMIHYFGVPKPWDENWINVPARHNAYIWDQFALITRDQWRL